MKSSHTRTRVRKRIRLDFRIRQNVVFRGHRQVGSIIEHDGCIFEARGRNEGRIGRFPTYRRAAVEVVDAILRPRRR
jgi:hypothetical protein